MLRRLRDAYRRLGPRRLAAAVLRSAADGVEAPWDWQFGCLNPWARTTSPTLISPGYIRFQKMPHQVLSRYVRIEGKHVLEIGGSQACIAARPFLDDGAARIVVTGLDHISEEGESVDPRLSIMKADALDLRSRFAAGSFDLVFGLSIIEHIPQPDRFLEEVHRVLAPGGLAFFEGCPLWSSPLGHHLWVADWGGPYKGKTSANYLFTGLSHGERPPQPALTALIASRVDTFQPVFKEATHGSASRPTEVRGMAATAAAVHGIRHDCFQVLRSGGCIGRRLPLLAAEARARAA